MSGHWIPPRTAVLIVGAGPTGLALAATLAKAGVDHVLVDKLAEGQNTSRAAVVHAHTLEALKELGVAGRLVDAGLRLKRFSISDRDRTLVQLRFDTLPTAFPFLLMLTQDATEKILADRLVELGGGVHRGVTATGFSQTPSAVQAQLVCAGKSQTIEAQYLVGADGMHSAVREAAGVSFPGGRYEDSFVLADVSMEWPHGREGVQLYFSPAGLVVVAPLPNGEFRIVATMEDAPEHPGLADIEAIVNERGPQNAPAFVTGLSWSSRFRLHHRLASAYQRGRIMLMGDAAHVHSPAGGQGMNTGIVDACVLGRLLGAVIRGEQPTASLALYEKLRRPAAAKVLPLAGGLTRMATMTHPAARTARNARLSLMGAVPIARRRMAMHLSGLSRKRAAVLPF